MPQQLDLQWEKRFEQHDPPTEDKVIQVDLGDQTHPKLIFISESLSPEEKQDLIALIKEYIDVFTWSYEDMLVSTLTWSCIVLTSNWMLRRSNNRSDTFDLILWRQSKLRSRNSSNVASFERNNTQTGLLILYPSLKRMKRFESVLTFVILI